MHTWVNPSWRCAGCAVPPGGYALLLTAAHGRPAELEVGAWDGGPGPAVLRLDPGSMCWWERACWVALALHDRADREVTPPYLIHTYIYI